MNKKEIADRKNLEKVKKLEQEKYELQIIKLKYKKLIDELKKKYSISKLKQTEQIKELQEKFINLTDNIPDFITYINANTFKYEFANKAFLKSFGGPHKRIIGRTVEKILGEKNYHFVFKYLEEARKGKQVYFEKEFEFDTGNRWIIINYIPQFDKTGKVTLINGISYDITDRKKAEKEVKNEQEKSKALLLNILPGKMAEELMETGKSNPRYYEQASVMFTDFKDFTLKCEKLTSEELVNKLHFYFVRFDEIITKYGLEKIKTVGDAYMCVGGLPVIDKQHPIKVILAALEIQNFMKYQNLEEIKEGKDVWQLRLGIHTGGLIAGVVGQKKFAYDVWGDTVNIAARIESSGEVGKVNISESTFQLVKDYFIFTSRGMIDIKNKEKTGMYFVDGIKPKNVMSQEGFIQNKNVSGNI